MTLLELSASGGVLIAAVLLLRRLLLRRLPKWTFLLLWAVALCRLLIPVRIPSPFSLYTGAAQAVQSVQMPAPVLSPAAPEPVDQSAALLQTGPWVPAGEAPKGNAVPLLPAVYGIGVAVCTLFFGAAYGRSLRRFRDAVPAEGDFPARWQREHPTLFPVRIKLCGGVSAPLTCGLLRPVILLPKDTDWSDRDRLICILTHEYVHIRRGDMLWKLLLAAAVCVHWFNPLVWAMYLCANQDLELACDEAVVGILGPDSRRGYALALLQTEEERGLPLHSAYRSKSSLEERIAAIMGTKKRPVWAVLAALLLVAAVAAVFATSRPPVIPHGDRPVDRGSEAPEGLWLEVVEDTASPCGLDYVVHNRSGYRVSYGEDDYYLEVEDGGEWYAVLTEKRWRVSHLKDDAPEQAYSSKTHTLDWTDYYGELFPGHYRLVKEVSVIIDDREETYRRSYALTAEFEVGSASPPAAHPEEDEEEPLVPDQIEGVWMEAVTDTVTPSGMEYVIHNETGRDLLYGAPYSLQVEKNGIWSSVELADGGEEMFFLSIGYGLDGVVQTSESRGVNWSYYYGELVPGHYRLVKSMHLGPAREPVTLYAEFDIKA